GPIYNPGYISGNIGSGVGDIAITGGSGSIVGTLTNGTINAGGGNVNLSGNNLLADSIIANAGAGTVTNIGNLRINAPITITGSFVESTIGSLTVGVTGPGNNGLLDVSGTANLGNARVNLVANVGGTISANQTYEVVASNTPIGTDYNGVVATATGYIATTQTVTVGNIFELLVKLSSGSYHSLFITSNRNTQSAGNVLDSLINLTSPTTAQNNLILAAQAQTPGSLPQFAKALDGEVHGSDLAVVPQAGYALANSVAGRLGDVVQNPASAPLLWGNATVELGQENSDNYASGFSSTLSQFTVGMDLAASGVARIGVGFSHSHIDIHANLGNGSFDENAGFVYGQMPAGRFIIDGLASYGGSTASSHRPDPTAPTSTLSTNNIGGSEALVSLGVNLPVTVAGVEVSPYGREIFQDITQNGAGEGNSIAALATRNYSGFGERTMLGISSGSKITDPLATLFTYQFNLAGGLDSGALLHPTLNATLAGIRTTITSPHVSPEFVQASVSATLRLFSGGYSYAQLGGEVRGGATQGSFTAGLRISF
ncbi:MAG TPA: autotransporter domain-containing protein, partial [Acidocella sp.]|nr:autotransporter domain-containing protein [Acidocella sp.]